MEILDAVKTSLRISHTALDSDLSQTINACKQDLKIVGVSKVEETDPLTAQAIKLYCKWQFDFQGQGDRYGHAYAGLRDSMALCGDYGKEAGRV